MATTSNGTAVSMGNTPQATNDVFTSAQTGLTDNTLTTVYLNVMANDLGGAAKTLYSLDSGTEATVALEQTALLTQDTARAEAVSMDYSAHGAHIWITSDGKVGYDASHLDASWLSNSFNTLGYAQDSFTYAIRLGNGTLSWATAYVNIAPPAPVVALAHDTGCSAADNITSDCTLSVGGVAHGATVQYSTDNGAHWNTSFSAVEGTNTVLVRQIDVAGNVSAAASCCFTLDTAAAVAPGVALAVDSGSSGVDHVTNVGTLNVTGVQSGATVQYSVDGGAHWGTSFGAVEGTNNVQVRQVDVAGNASAATSFSFTLDTSAAAPGVALAVDSGSSAVDLVTKVGTLNVTGVESGATVQYSVDGGAHWSTSFSAVEGVNNVQVRQVDVAGNASAATSFNFTLDTSVAAPGVALAVDSGSSAVDHVTKVGTLNVTGVESGATVQYSVDGGAHWSTSFSAVEGVNNVQVRQVDVAGNASAATSFSFTLDTSAAAPGVALAVDSGSSAVDHVTNVGTLNLTGVETGATMQYSVDGGAHWSTSFSAVADTNNVQVRQIDVAGNTSSATSFSFTLDTSAAAPGVALAVDSGSSASDHVTNVGTLNLSGVEAGATVEYSTDGGHTWSTSFSATEGVNDAQVRQTDIAGNTSDPTSFSFTLDTFAAAPGVALANDSGSSASDHVTNVGTLNLTGVETGATVEYSIDGGHTWSTSFSATEGLNDVQVRQTDIAGNTSDPTSFSFTLDTSAAAPGVALTTDSGSSAVDHVTNVGTLNLSGVETGATVEYSTDGGHTWSTSFSAVEGVNDVQVRQTDIAGNTSDPTSFSFTLDTSAAAPGVALATDSGSSASDHVTNAGTLNLTGVETSATVEYSIDGGHTWSTSFSAVEGLNDVQVRQTDIASNTSDPTSFSFTLDTSAAAPGVALATDSGSSAVDHVTKVGTLNMTGVETGATVQYSIDNGGHWNTSFSAVEGVNDVQVRQTDIAGNTSSATSLSFTLDTSAAAPGVALATDSGSSASDHVTNIGTLNLTGVETGATVEYSIDGGHTWSTSFSAVEGVNDVQVRQTDIAGNTSNPTSFSFTLDTSAAAPGVALAVDSGSSASDHVTNVGTLNLTGVETGATVEYSIDGGHTWNTSFSAVEGLNDVQVRQTDIAGNTSNPASFSFTLDTSAAAPGVALTTDSGSSAVDHVTNVGTLNLSGVETGATVEYSTDGGHTWSTSFSATEGVNDVQVRQTDIAGNTSDPTSFSFTLDTSAAAPGVALATDSGSSASDHVTNVGTLNLTGVETSATVEYSIDGGHTWNTSFSAVEGLNDVQVRQIDVAGNTSDPTSFSFTLDTFAAAPGVALTTDSGSSASDHVTNVGTLNLSGVETGATVEYSTDGGHTWSTSFSAVEGVNDVQVRQTDIAGNTSSATSFSFTLDTSATAPGVALTTDSGSSASDHVTNVGTLNLTGVETGATVEYSTDGGHTWNTSFSAVEGVNDVQVRQTDIAGNTSSATSFSFMLDTSATAPGVALTTDSGSSAVDHITNVGTLNLSGVETGATVEYSTDGGHTWNTSFSAVEGLNDVQVRQIDVAGNTSDPTSFSFTLDTFAAAPGVALTTDSGSSASDHVTNVGTLNLSGVETGATVEYSTDGGHTWSTSFSAVEGVNDVQVRQTDIAGNTSSATSFSFTLDTSATAPGVALTTDSGSSASDHVTNVGTLNLSGVETGATVEYSIDGGHTWNTSFSAVEGLNDVQVRQIDVAGNTSNPTSFSFTLDTSATAPGVALTTDSGSSASDHVTNVGTLNLSGVETGATVEYSIDGGHTWNTNFNATEGVNDVQVRQTDIAGNTSVPTSFGFTLDTSAAAPGVALATDSGSSTSDHVTNAGTLNLTGVETGATVEYSIDGGHTWNTSFSAVEGVNDVQVRQTDVAGNTSSATSFGFTLDTSAAAPGVALTTDSGSSASDHVTNVGTLNLTGIETGATVQYSLDNGSHWNTSFSAVEGLNNVQVRQIDVAGNTSSATSFSFTLDTSAAAPGVALTTDSGSSASDHVTNVGTLNLTGIETGATVQYSVDNGAHWSTSFGALEGTNNVQVRQIDVAGNTSAATSFGFTLDTSAAAPGVALTTDSGSSASDHVTNVGTLSLTGVENGATVQYSVDNGGHWNTSFSAVEGTNNVQVRQIDVAGNTSSATSFGFTLDTSAAAPGVALTTDSGSSASDHVTNVGTLNLTGVETGATVQYSADNGSHWNTSFSAVEGLNNVQVRQIDVAGNTSSATSFSFTLDTSAAAPGVALTTDSGSSASDHVTNVGTLNLTGIETGATVQYSVDNGAHWSTSFGALEGTNNVQVRQIDVAGNISNATSFNFTLDTSAAAPGVALTTDSGSSASDHVTNVGTLNLSGVETGATVQYSVDSGAHWSTSFSAVAGLNNVQVRQIDVAGNTSSATSFSFTLDTSAAAPGVALTTDSGSSASDHITNVGTLNLTGIETGATVQYSVDNGGHWNTSFSAVEGTNNVQVRQIDVAGNTSSATSFGFTLDTSAAAPGVALTTDSGSSASDHVTNVGTLNLTGIETGATVQYSVDNGGHWNTSFSAVEGTNNVQVRQIDVAGNISNATSFNFTLDTTAPSTLSWQYSGNTLTATTDTSNVWKVTVHDNTTNADYSATQQNAGTWTFTQQSLNLNKDSLTVTEWDTAGNTRSSTHAAPAGVAGSEINLALADPSGHASDLAVTIAGIPSGWTLNAGTDLGSGAWLVPTNDLGALTVTPPASFTGATVLTVTETWTAADGSHQAVTVADNVEAFAANAPIFAWSGDDQLTGSAGHDLFVFAQPIGNDTLHNLDLAADKIDLVGFTGITSFSDVQAHMTDDANGNAVIALGDGATITVAGVHATDLTSDNFVFDQEAVTTNAGVMTVNDGAMLPVGGTIDNTGTIALGSTGDLTRFEVLVKSATLEGGGHVTLSDDSHNVIFGSTPDATLVNVDNTIAGAGQLGAGQLTLVNEGTIVASGANALVIDTGAHAVVNTGTLEATGSGGLVIDSAVANTGNLWANNGNLTIHGDVTGAGSATISGAATLEFGGASAENTTFADGAAGTLKLDQSAGFTGTVSGFGAADTLDLADVLFNDHTTLSFTANDTGTGGTLTVSDGAHTAQVALQGNLSAGGFQLSHDQGSGTVVTYTPPPLPHVQEV
ncbi:Ig-like domain repeat protein [Burkholderia stagnalis]|uniref:beta strand repeat-containing protein n=2 Tax=Burkholderia stagnalis TaxID=1503054 RepID=UPI000F5E0F75|nr:Ig-like domain-containing protein [Burkholderia stagnalis]RQY33825.1 Ig-like domain repeat protein [Burkholderia stagnalis]